MLHLGLQLGCHLGLLSFLPDDQKHLQTREETSHLHCFNRNPDCGSQQNPGQAPLRAELIQPGFSPTLNPGKTSLQPSSILSGSPSSPAENTKSSSSPTNHCVPLPLSTSPASFYHAAHPGTISSWTLARCPSPALDSVLSVSPLPPSGKTLPAGIHSTSHLWTSSKNSSNTICSLQFATALNSASLPDTHLCTSV